MNKGTEIILHGEQFIMLPQKALYRPAERELIICDVHFGKASHFRKHGVQMPESSQLADFERLQFLIRTVRPLAVVILGDLFHSDQNREWWWFKAFLADNADVQFILVEGNHDVLKEESYNIPNLLKAYTLEEDNFIFSHFPLPAGPKFNICGHIHPGIRIEGKARQSATFPCFYINGSHLILPAFGHLTGLALLEKEPDATYYIVTGNKVVAVKG
jgi:uncharacterized protein